MRKGQRARQRARKNGKVASATTTSYPAKRLREWDRATDLLSAFAVTGFLMEESVQGDLLPVRPASILLVGNPGSGKTEIIERFKRNAWLSYHNDLTVKSLIPLLRKSESGKVTHVAAPEFNKWFQRKSAIAENCVGLLSSAMEEGINTYSVGPISLSFENARLGIFGGMTPGSLSRRKSMLDEMGFISRACVIEWLLPKDELQEIMRRLNLGIMSDLEPVDLIVPTEGRATVQWDGKLGEAVERYVTANWPRNLLRGFKRFKVLLMARAYLVAVERNGGALERGHIARVTDDDWQWIKSYEDYWQRMQVGD